MRSYLNLKGKYPSGSGQTPFAFLDVINNQLITINGRRVWMCVGEFILDITADPNFKEKFHNFMALIPEEHL